MRIEFKTESILEIKTENSLYVFSSSSAVQPEDIEITLETIELIEDIDSSTGVITIRPASQGEASITKIYRVSLDLLILAYRLARDSNNELPYETCFNRVCRKAKLSPSECVDLWNGRVAEGTLRKLLTVNGNDPEEFVRIAKENLAKKSAPFEEQ